MSDTTPTQLDIEEQIERIRRARIESDRFAIEMQKLAAETIKLGAEGGKLEAEKRKFNRETVLAPLIAAVALVGGVLGTASFLARFLR